jgi:hypothetical protein
MVRNGRPFKEEFTLAECDACGNDYDKSFQAVARGRTHTFDSFECAIHVRVLKSGACCCAREERGWLK